MSASIRRLEFDELAPQVKAVLEARVKRLGYLGEFFKCSAHQPDVLTPFMDMTEALKKALPDRLTEVGALTVACFMGNDYERNQHERLSVRLGFGKDWVAAVEQLAPATAPGLLDEERAVQRLVLAMLINKGKGVDVELEAVITAIGQEQAIAVMFLVGRYITHAMVVNALSLAPPVPSVFEDQN